jgi:hypothetical protein
MHGPMTAHVATPTEGVWDEVNEGTTIGEDEPVTPTSWTRTVLASKSGDA